VESNKFKSSSSAKSFSSDKSRKSKQGSFDVDDVDLALYSHQNVDRFAALLDIWVNEVGFLEMKRQVRDYVSYFFLKKSGKKFPGTCNNFENIDLSKS
jgi:hypothetical protein